ncbi:hypothetical protein [Gephyromycinifex aptenodytis]|uniref:hypothetical protein n=1 Tax=Gephyromycinifex aptenodytis TaxID=2716227 RepID=UPI0014457391|nr:hypothetical protein [Gephyromycinifex aptenodytis]
MTDASSRDILLNRLLRIPTPVMAGVLLVLIFVGLMLAGPVGAVLLGLALLTLSVMLALVWPAIPTTERMLRLAVILLLLAISVVRLGGL